MSSHVGSSLTTLLPLWLWLTALAVYLLAGTVKGVFGIGLPTLGIGLLAQLTETPTAIALAVLPMVVLNAWQLYRSAAIRTVWRRYWRLAVVLGVTILLVSSLVPRVPPRLITLSLGAIIVLFALSNLWRRPPPLPDRLDRPAQWLTGVLSGLVGGLAGLWAPIIVVYMSARRVEKDDFVDAMGLLLFIGSLLLFVGYSRSGLITLPITMASTTLLVPALIGFALGERLRTRLSVERFHRSLLWLFLLMGLNLLRRGLAL